MATVADLRKWTATLKISLAKHSAYKLNFLLLIVGPTIVFFLIKYNLWSSIFLYTKSPTINGYDLSGMLEYQAFVLIIGLLCQGYNSMSLAEDIRLGRISTYLIYPFEFWKFHTASFLSFQVLQTAVAILTLTIAYATDLVHAPLSTVAVGLTYCLLVSGLWFVCQYLIGLLAFWMEEVWVLRVMFVTTAQFLSGSLVPLDFYPRWLLHAIEWTPFPYMVYAPVKIMMNEYDGSISFAVAMTIFWIGVGIAFSRWLLSRGLHLYTAAGM